MLKAWGIGARLRLLRGELSQEAFARQLGLRRPVYRRYETGERNPPIDMLIKLARFGRTTIDWIVTGRSGGRSSVDQPMVMEAGASYGRSAVSAPAIPLLSKRAMCRRPPRALTAGNIDTYLRLPPTWAGPQQLVITMPDDSMEPLIRRNDLVGIEAVGGRFKLREGAMIAAWLDEPAGLVVRRLDRDDRHWVLMPENRMHRTIVIPKKGGSSRLYRVAWWFHRDAARRGRPAQK